MANFGNLQIFEYFPTDVFWIDLEWPILAILQLFQYFPTEVVQIDPERPIWPFGIFSYLFPPKYSEIIWNCHRSVQNI